MKNLFKGLLSVVVALAMVITVMPTVEVRAEEPKPYCILAGECYETLQAAVDASTGTESQPTKISLPENSNLGGPGLKVDGKHVEIDFKGSTYTAYPGIGSSGTETIAFQLKAGSTVILKNGTLTSDGREYTVGGNVKQIKRLIQNYSDLTLVNFNLDGSQLVNQANNDNIVMSNNSGDTVIKGNSNFTVKPGHAAFDICNYLNYDPVSVKFDSDFVGSISGKVIYDSADSSKASLTINGGNFSNVTFEKTPRSVETSINVVGSVPGANNDVFKVAEMNGVLYDTLQAAVTAAGNTGNTVTLLKDVEGPGVKVAEGQNVVIDFDGHTYTAFPGVGSSGTETIAFQLKAGSTVILKNGTLTSEGSSYKNSAQEVKYIKRLIQNYSNLTLENFDLDGTKLVDPTPGTPGENIVLSNNNGNTVISGDSDILTNEEDYAFDVYYNANPTYPDVSVTFDESFTGTVDGMVEYYSTDNTKASLVIKGGNFTTDTPIKTNDNDANITIYGGRFSTDVSDYLAPGLELVGGRVSAIVPKSTVEFIVDGKVWRTYRVTKGADIRMPEVPEKEGYTGEWDHDGENIRTATTITAVYTKVEEPVNNTDLSDYADFQLPVYTNSRVTNISTANGSITVDGYMFKANANLDKEDSIWREIIFVNEEDYSMAKAYRKQVTPVYNTWLNKNMTATGNGAYKLDYANYTVTFSNTDINNYVGNTAATRMATGSYLAYMRISDGTDSYLFPLKDIVLSDGSTLALPFGFEVVDTTTRALRYIVK